MTEHTHIWRRVKLKHKRLSTKTEMVECLWSPSSFILKCEVFFEVVSQGLFKIKISIGRKFYVLVSWVDYGRLGIKPVPVIFEDAPNSLSRFTDLPLWCTNVQRLEEKGFQREEKGLGRMTRINDNFFIKEVMKGRYFSHVDGVLEIS